MLWISWHRSRRTRTLARALNTRLCEIQIEGGIVGRHGLSAMWTLSILRKWRPRIILLQYSFLLMIILALYKKLAPYSVVLVSDCHTKALRRELSGAAGWCFRILKRKSLSTASLLIISNKGLLPEAQFFNRRCFVLPDHIPELSTGTRELRGREYCVFVMSYARDEPFEVLFHAAEIVSAKTTVYITGQTPNVYRMRFHRHSGVYFTDFLSDGDYDQLLAGASCIVALTCDQDCLQSAGYEALAVCVPFVTSDTAALRQYFGNAAIFVEHEPSAVAVGIEHALTLRGEYKNRLAQLKRTRDDESEASLQTLRKAIFEQHEGNGQQ